MRLIGKLKEKVEQAESIREKEDILKETGIELTQEELQQVVGGFELPGDRNTRASAELYRTHPVGLMR